MDTGIVVRDNDIDYFAAADFDDMICREAELTPSDADHVRLRTSCQANENLLLN